MHLCQSIWDTPQKHSLFLYLNSLRVLQLLGLVHVHEEVLQQPLSLHQVVCIHLLVDHRQILPITLGVLHRSQSSVAVCKIQTYLVLKTKKLKGLLNHVLFDLMFLILIRNWISYHNCFRSLSAD